MLQLFLLSAVVSFYIGYYENKRRFFKRPQSMPGCNPISPKVVRWDQLYEYQKMTAQQVLGYQVCQKLDEITRTKKISMNELLFREVFYPLRVTMFEREIRQIAVRTTKTICNVPPRKK